MSSIQERLQMQRVPLDTWNVREQLCLASAVVRSGDQNWMSVSRALKTVSEPNRPPDWYSQKSCAAQYGALLENVETPKRKKRTSEGAAETPQDSILKKLTQERITEIQKTVAEMNQQYEQLKNEITEVRNQSTTEERLREIWTAIETAKRAREREASRRAAMLKEREERRARVDRTWRPPAPTTPTSPVAPATPSSPLLTSLLKSSPVVTTPQHISHPASVVDAVSPSVTAPTLSMLLEKSTTHEREKSSESNKHAAIEHIKSQLVQIEQQLKANSSPPAPLPAPMPAPLPAPAVDIDDIEIKAEDVYAFRDIDLHLPVAPIHKGARPNEKPPKEEAKEEDDMCIDAETTVQPQEVIKEEQITVEEVDQEVTVDVEAETSEETIVEDSIQEELTQEEPTPTPIDAPAPIAYPGVKFPTTEIKVIQEIQITRPDESKVIQEIKEEPKEPEPEMMPKSQPEPEIEEEIVLHQEETVADVVEQEISTEPPVPSPPLVEQPVESPVEEPVEHPIDQPVEQPVETTVVQPVEEIVQAILPNAELPSVEEEVVETETHDIPLPPDPEPVIEVSELPLPPEPEEPPQPEPEPEPEVKEEVQAEVEETEVSVTTVEETAAEVLKKDEDSEDSKPLKQMIIEETLRNAETSAAQECAPETHHETDDDTPMEVSREEEKDGKKRRDYSRKKKADSRTCSGSESAAEASAPESPSASVSDADRQHRLWKKSVMLVYSRLCAHKYASLFVRPISDEEAPGYSAVVRRPMDLSAIRRNIDNGQIRNTSEFQRDVLLMLSNALIYNSSEHSVYTMAKEMHEEAVSQLGFLLAAEAHSGLLEAPPRRKRRRHEEPRAQTKKP